MNITVTWKQLQKIRELPPDEFKKLRDIVGERGVRQVNELDLLDLGLLRGAKLVKAKAGKAWVTFEVNGVRPYVFTGNVRKRREPTDVAKVGSIFKRLFTKYTRELYGQFGSAEWAVLSRISREYTLEEIRELLKLFMRGGLFKKGMKSGWRTGTSPVVLFASQRHKIYRELRAITEVGEATDEDQSQDDGGW